MRRRTAWVLGLVLVLALAGSSIASAKYRGTDLWSNVMPSSGVGGLVDRYPLSNYQLDVHVDGPSAGFSGVSAGDMPAMVAQLFAQYLFFGAVLFIRVVIAVFQWAFNVDLVTGKNGALASASVASNHYYSSFVAPFMTTFVILLGGWIGYKAIKTHEKSHVGGAVVRVIVLSVISLAIINHPQETIGRAFQMINGISTALIARGGDSQSVSDSIFQTFVYRPWAVLQFSGMKVCTGAVKDSDGFPLASTNGNPAKVCHSVLSKDRDGHGNYAALFLRDAYGSDDRNHLYDALREGKAPDEPQFAGVTIDRTDAPAVDMMQAGGAGQRLLYTLFFVVCIVFGSLLIALVAIASLFAQVALVALVILTPFTLPMAMYPPLHRYNQHWLSLIGKTLIGKAVYALLLAVLLSTSAAMMVIAGTQGYAIALCVQALIFGGAFIFRKQIIAKATSSKAAQHYENSESHVKSESAQAAAMSLGAISGGASTFATTMREGWGMRHEHEDGGEHGKQEHAMPADSSSPPASAGREHSPGGKEVSPQEWAPPTGATSGPAPQPAQESASDPQPQSQEETMPTRSFREDLEIARNGGSVQPDHLNEESPANGRHNGAVAASSSLHEEIRAQRELREVAEDHDVNGDRNGDLERLDR